MGFELGDICQDLDNDGLKSKLNKHVHMPFYCNISSIIWECNFSAFLRAEYLSVIMQIWFGCNLHCTKMIKVEKMVELTTSKYGFRIECKKWYQTTSVQTHPQWIYYER